MLVFLASIVGLFTGFSAGVGAARMYHIPEKQGLGAFRTLGEINACNGDPVSHFTFGLGYFFNSAATAVGTGALTQDIVHRVIPNWGIALAITFSRKRDRFSIIQSPTFIGFASAIVGAIILPVIVLIYDFIPVGIKKVGDGVLVNASKMLFDYIMPILFLIAAMDAGAKTGVFALILGVFFQIISGNALPGVILGILVGSAWKNAGLKSLQFWLMFLLVMTVVVVIAYLRIDAANSNDKLDDDWTWDKIIHFEPAKTAAKQFISDLTQLQNSGFDISIATYPGMMNEV